MMPPRKRVKRSLEKKEDTPVMNNSVIAPSPLAKLHSAKVKDKSNIRGVNQPTQPNGSPRASIQRKRKYRKDDSDCNELSALNGL